MSISSKKIYIGNNCWHIYFPYFRRVKYESFATYLFVCLSCAAGVLTLLVFQSMSRDVVEGIYVVENQQESLSDSQTAAPFVWTSVYKCTDAFADVQPCHELSKEEFKATRVQVVQDQKTVAPTEVCSVKESKANANLNLFMEQYSFTRLHTDGITDAYRFTVETFDLSIVCSEPQFNIVPVHESKVLAQESLAHPRAVNFFARLLKMRQGV